MASNGAPGRELPQRLYWIDWMRGVAALIIVVFHYHHFYLRNSEDRPNLPDIADFPFGQFLFPLYAPVAANAVELFWLISGAVFLHVYQRRRATLWQFSIARFARLYPLHLATLLLVAAIQVISLQSAGHWQIYGNNDLKHFGLQLLFASNSVTLSHGLSFNGPIWSVSLEIPVYFLFLLLLPVLRVAPMRASAAALALSTGLVAAEPFDLPLIRYSVFLCAAHFFFGCLLYTAFIRALSGRLPAWLPGAACLLVIACGWYLANPTVIVAGCAGALVLLALLGELFVPHRKANSALGDLSYAIYLVHVPLQMILLLGLDLFFAGSRAVAGSSMLLPAYLIATLLIAHVVHHKFERPAGKALRHALSRKPKEPKAHQQGGRP